MQETSALYKQIYNSQNYYVETSVAIGEAGRLITEKAEVILFAGTAILISTSDADGGYGENMLISVKTTKRTFSENKPSVGCCICGEVQVEMHMPIGEIKRMAQIMVFIRLVSNEDNSKSEWVRKGVFYLDTRDNSKNQDNLDILTIHGYDAMMRANKIYPSNNLQWAAKDWQVIEDIASHMQVSINPTVWEYIPKWTDSSAKKGYMIPLPVEYTMREVLGYIGQMYGGNWIINDVGDLTFIPLWALPKETSILTDHLGNRLLFGQDYEYPEEEVRILV